MKLFGTLAMTSFFVLSFCFPVASAEDCRRSIELYNKATISSDMPEKERFFKEALASPCTGNTVLARIHNNLGDTYENMGRLDEALKEYNKAAELYPELPTPYIGLGDVYSKMRNKDRAKEYYDRYWRLASYKTRGQLVDALSPGSPQRSLVPVPKADLYFGFNETTLSAESQKQLQELLAALMGNDLKSYKFELAGHTCDIGTDTYNQKLSVRRADAVRKWLVSRGCPASRLAVTGYGKTRPVADNATEEGKRLNRRVEIRTISTE
jgi:outer membrane protein OmpA-like peptidoglycan-associated protein